MPGKGGLRARKVGTEGMGRTCREGGRGGSHLLHVYALLCMPALAGASHVTSPWCLLLSFTSSASDASTGQEFHVWLPPVDASDVALVSPHPPGALTRLWTNAMHCLKLVVFTSSTSSGPDAGAGQAAGGSTASASGATGGSSLSNLNSEEVYKQVGQRGCVGCCPRSKAPRLI